MKLLGCFVFTLLSLVSFSQKRSAASYAVAAYAPVTNLHVQTLAAQITEGYKTDYDKVKAIFNWITANISYNVNPYLNSQRFGNIAVEEDDTFALKSLSERVAESVLKRGVAFCDGYSRLFKTLCDYAGIRAEVITGYAKTNIIKIDQKFRSNHRWNAVMIDSTWHLLDATWATGYTRSGTNEFIRFYNDYYFLTPPEDFVRDHYPEDPNWTLLAKPPVVKEFQYSPFKNQAFLKHKITSFKPAKGVIEAALGDTISFELQTDDEIKTMFVTDTMYADTTIFPQSEDSVIVQPRFIQSGDKLTYAYIVSSDAVEWLNVMFNNDAILRYKLNIKKNYTASK